MKKIFALTSRCQNGVFHSKTCRAFSLVEVVLALGIVSFALLGLVALLPAGIQSTRDSLEESGAINVLSRVIVDRKVTDPTKVSTLYQIPALTAASSNYFGVTAANSNSADFSASLYRVTYVITPPAAGRMYPYQVYIKVSWPAAAASANAAGYVEESVTFPHP